MPAGRPRAITKEKEKIIVNCFVDGLTDEETALYTDISSRTIAKCRNGELFPAIKKATIGKKMFYLRKIRDGKQRDWVRIAWYLERMYPTQFSRPEVLMQITQNTLNQTTNNALIISAEAAEGVINRLQSADGKVSSLFKKRNGNDNGQKTTET